MTVSLCIASRGRPEELKKTIRGAIQGACSAEICVALDFDDPAVDNSLIGRIGYHGVRYSIEGRDDSLGAKYNRCASIAPASTSLFVLGVDDAFPSSFEWDIKLADAAAQFEDGVGVVYFGQRKGAFDLPDGIAVTRGWIDKVGFFCPEHFPFWWHDTWIDELARMTGRFVWADVSWEKHGSSEVNGHKTTRMRDVAFWAKLFDDMRPLRVSKAIDMIADLSYPSWLRSQLMSEMQNTADVLRGRNSYVRENGSKFEREYGAERGVDAGYERLKRKAEEMMR